MIRKVFLINIILQLIYGIYAIHDPQYSHGQETKGYRQDVRIEQGRGNSDTQGQLQVHVEGTATITRSTSSSSGRTAQYNLGDTGNVNYHQETTRGGYYGTRDSSGNTAGVGQTVGVGHTAGVGHTNHNYNSESTVSSTRGGHYGTGDTSGITVGLGHTNRNYNTESTVSSSRGGYYGTGDNSGVTIGVGHTNRNYNTESTASSTHGGHHGTGDSSGSSTFGIGHTNRNYNTGSAASSTHGGHYGTGDSSGSSTFDIGHTNRNYNTESAASSSRGGHYGTGDSSGSSTVGIGHSNHNYNTQSTVSSTRGDYYGSADNSGSSTVGVGHTNHNYNTESTISSYRTECPPNATGPFPYLMDCRKFLNCWKGRGVVQPCAPGTAFNPETLECDNPEKVVCYSYNSAQSIGHQSGQSTGSNRLARMENPRDINPPVPASRSDKNSVKCSPNYSGLEPHPYNCAKFLNCANGVTHIQDCGPGTVFNPLMSVCDWPYNTDCGDRENSDGSAVVEASEVHSTQYNGDEKQYGYQESGSFNYNKHNQDGYYTHGGHHDGQAGSSQSGTQTSGVYVSGGASDGRSHEFNYGSGNQQGLGSGQTTSGGFGSYGTTGSQHRHGQGTIHQEGQTGTGSGVSGSGQTTSGGFGSYGTTGSQHRHGQGTIHQEGQTGTASGVSGSAHTTSGGFGSYGTTDSQHRHGQGTIHQTGQTGTGSGVYISRENNQASGSGQTTSGGFGSYGTTNSEHRNGQATNNQEGQTGTGGGFYITRENTQGSSSGQTNTGRLGPHVSTDNQHRHGQGTIQGGQTGTGSGVYISGGNEYGVGKGDYHYSYNERDNQNIDRGQINNGGGGTYVASESQHRHGQGVYNRGDGSYTATGSGSYSSGGIEHRRDQDTDEGQVNIGVNKYHITAGSYHRNGQGSYPRIDENTNQKNATSTNNGTQYRHGHGSYQYDGNSQTHTAGTGTYIRNNQHSRDYTGDYQRTTNVQAQLNTNTDGDGKIESVGDTSYQQSTPIFNQNRNIDHRQGYSFSVGGSATRNVENSVSLPTVYGNQNSDEDDGQTTVQQTIPFQLEGNENTVWATRVDGQSSIPIFTPNINTDHRHTSVEGSTTIWNQGSRTGSDSTPIYQRPGGQTQSSSGSESDYQHQQTTSTTQAEGRWPHSRAPSHTSTSSYDIQQATVHRIQPSNYEVHENINESSPSSKYPKTITTTYFYAEEPKEDVDELDEFSGTIYGGDVSGALHSKSFDIYDGQQIVHVVPSSATVDLSTTSSNRHIAIIDPNTPVFTTDYDPSSNLYGGLLPPHLPRKTDTIVETYTNIFQDQDPNDPFLLQDLGLPQPSDHLLPPLLPTTKEMNEPRTQFTYDPSLTRVQPPSSYGPTVEPPSQNFNDRRPSFTFDPTLRNPNHKIPDQDSIEQNDLNKSLNNRRPNISYSPSYSSVIHSRNSSEFNNENPWLTRPFIPSESTNIPSSVVNNKTDLNRFNFTQTQNTFVDNPNNSPTRQSTIFYDREEVKILPGKLINDTEPSPIYSRMIPVRPIETSSTTSSTSAQSSYTRTSSGNYGNYYYESSKNKTDHNTDAEMAALPISEALKALLRPYFNRSGTITEDTANKMDDHIMKITKPSSGSVKVEDDDVVNQTELIFAGEQEILNSGGSGRNEENNVSDENFQSQTGITFNRHISKSNEDDVEVIGTDETNIGYRGRHDHRGNHQYHTHGHSVEYHRNNPHLPNPFSSASQTEFNDTTTHYSNNNNHGSYDPHGQQGPHGHHGSRGPHRGHGSRGPPNYYPHHGRGHQSCNHNAEWHKLHGLPMPDNFDCQNGICLKRSQVCDGVNNCGNNNLDEVNCGDIGYEVRLSNEDGSTHMGRVEVKVRGKWGYVCDDSFGIKDADVLCRELQFPLGANEVRGNSFYPPNRNMVDENGRVRFLMDKVECNGDEASLKDCHFSGWGVHDCDVNEVVGVVCKQSDYACPNDYWLCKTSQECIFPSFVCDNVHDCADHSDESPEFCNSTVEYRLVGGRGHLEGRLEVKYRGVWGTVCSDRFTRDAAQVACNSMNLYGVAQVVKNEFDVGTGPIWLDEVTCLGNEASLDQCGHHAWGEHNCNHSEDVGIRCSTSTGIPAEVSEHGDDSQWSIKIMQRSLNYEPECGKISPNLNDSISNQFMERVIKGTKAQKGHHPWQATLRAKGVHGKSTHWCGAVLISQKHVLTAAHCLTGFAKGAYFIRVGDHFSDIPEPSETDVQIENWYIHENFRKGQHMNNDIALVKLKTAVQFTEYIQPACLPSKDAELKTGANCTISGWGSIQSGVSTPSNDLRFAKVPILSPNVCKLPHVYGNTITDGMFCAGFLDEGVDACDGDSGGPLTCTDEDSETVYGIISWGQHCGYSNKPGVYVNIIYYLDWIDEKLKLLS